MGTAVRKPAQTHLRGHAGEICRIMFVQIPTRLLWIAPLFLRLSIPIRVAWLFFFGLFAVLPLRYSAACRMRNITGAIGKKAAPWCRRVSGGALRCLLGGVWGIPLFGMLGLFYRYIFVLDASRYARDAAKLGGFLARHANETTQQEIGLLVVAAVFLISLAIFAYGWRRHLLFEFMLTDDALPIPTLTAARTAIKARRQAVIKILFLNLLPLLPAFVLPSAFLCWRSGGVQNMLMALFLLISNGLAMDPAALWITLAIFLCLYVPLIPYRKARYAALVNEYEG